MRGGKFPSLYYNYKLYGLMKGSNQHDKIRTNRY